MDLFSFGSDILSEREKRNISILETLRRLGPLSRPEISQRIGLNVVTISNYIDNFRKQNLVFEKKLDVSEGGRRPVLLDLNRNAAYALGIGINLFDSIAALVDLKGNIIARVKMDKSPSFADEVAQHCMQLIKEILQKVKRYTNKIRGIGLGVAGLVNKKTDTIYWPQKIDGTYSYVTLHVPLREVLEKNFGFPVIIENDATCACFGEQWLRKDLECSNAIFMFSGVGCGIMIKGDIYTGSNGFAGEVAISGPALSDRFGCSFGKPCLIQRWEADLGILDDVKELIKSRESRIVEFCQGDINNLSLKNVFQAANAKDALACEVMERAAQRLGAKIAYLVNLLNPDIVIVGGGFEEAGEVFLSRLRSTVNEWAFKEITSNLKIVYSDLAENATAIGSASLIVRRIFAQ